MIFALYCFLGWIFETIYVSLDKKQFVNRGFMNGPVLPLYGCGAVSVLFVVIPVVEYPALVFTVGMVWATALEFATGVVMEALFQIRYWDYSDKRFQFRGYISLSSSLTWGVMSLALIYGMQRPVDALIRMLPDFVLTPLSLALAMGMSADFALSFKTALDLRQVLVKAEELRREIKKLHGRLELLETFLQDDVRKRRDGGGRLSGGLNELHERLEDLRKGLPVKRQEQFREELSDMRMKHEVTSSWLSAHFSKDKARLLRRNPSAFSRKYQEILEDLRDLGEKKNKD